MKILEGFGGPADPWTKDPLGPAEKIYVLDGTQNDKAFGLPRLRDFHSLPWPPGRLPRVRGAPWVGTGQLAGGGFCIMPRRPPPEA